MQDSDVFQLEARLEEFKTNLSAVDNALAVDPDNEEFRRIKADLEEVLVYYSDKLAEKRAEEADPAVAVGLIGRACVTSTEFSHGVVTKLGKIDRETRLPKTVVVQLFDEMNTEVELDVANVRLITPCPVEDVQIGGLMQALYRDGVWYNCIVESMNDGLITVKYEDYEEEETLPLDRIRLRATQEKKPRWTGKDKVKKEKVITTPAGYKIPSALIAKAGDSAAVRQMKRRKLEALKREQKMKKLEEEATERQQAWKEHMSSTQSKLVRGRGISSRTSERNK